MADWNPPSPAELLASLQVTPAERDRIAGYKQRTPGWFRSRYGRVTYSKFSAAAGESGPAAQRDYLRDMVWPECAGLVGYGAILAHHGTTHEDFGRDVYLADRRRAGHPHYSDSRCVLRETGLLVSLEYGWLAGSPDFVVTEPRGARAPPAAPPRNPHHLHDPYFVDMPQGFVEYLRTHPVGEDPAGFDPEEHVVVGGGEIKCPAAGTKELYSSNPKHAEFGFPKLYIPQVQGSMSLNGWDFEDTVVFTPARVEVVRLFRDEPYWTGSLLPALRTFYFQKFLPMLELRVAGRLHRGTLVDVDLPVPRPRFTVHETGRAVLRDPVAIMLGHVVHDAEMETVKEEAPSASQGVATQAAEPCPPMPWLRVPPPARQRMSASW